MNDRRLFAGLAAALVLTALVLAIVLRVLAPTPIPVPDGPRRTVTPIMPRLQPTDPVLPLPRPVPDLPEPTPRDLAMDEAFAALGDASGHGFIVCRLPADTPKGARLFGTGHQERGTSGIRALVQAPEGSAVLGEKPGVPIAVATWSEAWPGEQGVCELEEPRKLEHRIAIDWLDGPVDLEYEGTCPEGRMDGDVLVVRSFARVPCTASVRSTTPGDGSGMITLAADEPRNDLVLELEPLGTMPDVLDMVDSTVEEMSMRTQGASPFQVALEQDGLSPEAKILLKRWKRDADATEAEMKAILEQIRESADAMEETMRGMEDLANERPEMREVLERDGLLRPEE